MSVKCITYLFEMHCFKPLQAKNHHDNNVSPDELIIFVFKEIPQIHTAWAGKLQRYIGFCCYKHLVFQSIRIACHPDAECTHNDLL